MPSTSERTAPGIIRDAIISVLTQATHALSVKQIESLARSRIGDVAPSSIRSYLRLNTPGVFSRVERGKYVLSSRQPLLVGSDETIADERPEFAYGRSRLVNGDCFEIMGQLQDESFHAIVTDPPYGLHEYTPEQQAKLRAGKGGVWRIPPSYDGNKRSPLPRFTTLTDGQLSELREFFTDWGIVVLRKLVPGGNCVVASNPLLSYIVSDALARAGLERRGEIVRLTMTMRGGDRPKAAHHEFADVSVMPRSMWEPWLVYRKPIEGRVQDNLRRWGTGGFRRPSTDRPFGDVIQSAPTRKKEREVAPHPSLKPQAFMRELVRAVLPLGDGVVCDPFAGAGSTIAAAEAIGYRSFGIEMDPEYFRIAKDAIPALAKLPTRA